MNLYGLVKNILSLKKEINTKNLPSQGLFYKDDFKIFIKRSDIEDIIEYEYNYVKDDIGIIINKIKRIVKKNLTFSNGYSFGDLKSIDIIFLFLEIVKFTKDKPIFFSYINDLGEEIKIEFGIKNFNYHRLSDDIMKNYDKKEKCFNIQGYKYTLPSIGVENCLTEFLIRKSVEPDAHVYNDYFYSFTHFVNNKRYLSFEEIENLVQIFNFDIEDKELRKVKEIVKIFEPLQTYSLINGETRIDISSKIDLSSVWK